MAQTSDFIRGNTDTIILSQLMRHDSYGYEINKAILADSDGNFELKEATLYTCFRRLEDSGFINSYWGDENTGARRRYYRITTLGVEKFRNLLGEWRKNRDILDRLIGERENYYGS